MAVKFFNKSPFFAVLYAFLPFLSTTMLPDWTDQLIFTCISKKMGVKIFKKVRFLRFFYRFEHDNVARLDRPTNFYMYLEKNGVKIFKKIRFCQLNAFFTAFDMPATPAQKRCCTVFYDIPSKLSKKIWTHPLPYRRTRRVSFVLDTRRKSPEGALDRESSTMCGRPHGYPGTQKSMGMSFLDLPLYDSSEKSTPPPP